MKTVTNLELIPAKYIEYNENACALDYLPYWKLYYDNTFIFISNKYKLDMNTQIGDEIDLNLVK